MTKRSISLTVTAALGTATLLGIAACDRTKIQRESRDVEEARQELHEEKREQTREVGEAKAELKEEQAELSIEVQEQINDLEERYLEIEKDAVALTQRLQTQGPEGTHTQQISEIEQAKTMARNRIDEVRNAKTADEATLALETAEDALDTFDRTVDRYDNV